MDTSINYTVVNEAVRRCLDKLTSATLQHLITLFLHCRKSYLAAAWLQEEACKKPPVGWLTKYYWK